MAAARFSQCHGKSITCCGARLKDAGRLRGKDDDDSENTGARKNEADRRGLRTPSPPRPIRLSATGAVILIACVASIGGSVVGAVALHQRAQISARQAALFASDAVATEARVVSVERRGSGGDRRTVVHYEYTAVGQRFRDSSEVRRRNRDAYAVGAPIDIRFLAEEPSASWIEGRSPRRFPFWPAYAIPAAALLASRWCSR